jgi:hypothetical protein
MLFGTSGWCFDADLHDVLTRISPVQPVPSTYLRPELPQEQVRPCLLSPFAPAVAGLSVQSAFAGWPAEAMRTAFWVQALAGLAQASMSASNNTRSPRRLICDSSCKTASKAWKGFVWQEQMHQSLEILLACTEVC